MRQVIEAAIPGPELGRAFEHRRDEVADVLQLVHVEGRENAEVLELRRAVARRLAEVEAFAAGGLQLVDLLFVLRERRLVHLDAGGLLEVRDHRIGEFVRPHEQVELARGRERVLDVERAGEADGAERRGRLQQRAARQHGRAHALPAPSVRILFLHADFPPCGRPRNAAARTTNYKVRRDRLLSSFAMQYDGHVTARQWGFRCWTHRRRAAGLTSTPCADHARHSAIC